MGNFSRCDFNFHVDWYYSIPSSGNRANCGYFVSPALVMGFILFFLKISRKQDVGVETLFEWFSKLFKAFGLNFMMQLFIFLWTLLFIIPGIIAQF